VVVSADLSVIEVLLRAAVTSLTASETFSTMVDIVICGVGLLLEELNLSV
jgi:hypothetical protein